MTKVLTRLTLLFALVPMIACNSSDMPDQEAKEKVQETAKASPDTPEEFVEQASFTDLDGDKVNMSEFEGKVVMIDFWETWCKPCLASFPTMQDLLEEYPDNFTVLAVTPGFTDTAEDARSFARKNDYDFNYLMDSNGLHEKLEVQGIPYKIFVDADGNFIQRSMGSHGPQEDYEMIKQIIEEHQDSSEVESET